MVYRESKILIKPSRDGESGEAGKIQSKKHVSCSVVRRRRAIDFR
jgi:hypothetical protein